jgi:hypothetical protein
LEIIKTVVLVLDREVKKEMGDLSNVASPQKNGSPKGHKVAVVSSEVSTTFGVSTAPG